jgi:AcrR family transcriptional regulator
MGLRERKKERTRDQLAAAACELFIQRGYDATTVEDIAAAIEVSPRTFFRYYPTKVDVAVEILRAAALDLLEVFITRPTTEPLAASLRATAGTHVALLQERSTQLSKIAQVLEANPSLRGPLAELQRTTQDQLTTPIAQRLGVDPTVDIRPRLIAALTIATLVTVTEHWGRSLNRCDLHQLTEDAFDFLETGLQSLTDTSPQLQPQP